MPIALPEPAREPRRAVTRPTGSPSSPTTCAPSLRHRAVRPSKPTSASRVAAALVPTRSRSGRSSRAPCRASRSTASPPRAGCDSAFVSWPTITCIFSSRRTRCGSRPNGFTACSAPASMQRVPQVLAGRGRVVDLVAELAHEADPQHQARHARDRARGRAPRYGKASFETSKSVSFAERRRGALGPARFTAAMRGRDVHDLAVHPPDRVPPGEPLLHAAGARRGGGHVVLGLGQARHRAVVEDRRRRRRTRCRSGRGPASCRRSGWGRCARGSAAASGPRTISLPSVETSIRPSDSCTAVDLGRRRRRSRRAASSRPPRASCRRARRASGASACACSGS